MVLNLIGTLLSSSLCAYSFARLRFRGRGVLFVIVLSTMMIPLYVTLIPTYIIWKRTERSRHLRSAGGAGFLWEGGHSSSF